jgi:hypothetical protein
MAKTAFPSSTVPYAAAFPSFFTGHAICETRKNPSRFHMNMFREEALGPDVISVESIFGDHMRRKMVNQLPMKPFNNVDPGEQQLVNAEQWIMRVTAEV